MTTKRICALLVAALALVLGMSPAHAEDEPVANAYEAHKLMRVSPKSNGEVLAFGQFGAVLECRPRIGEMHIVVPPDAVEAVLELDPNAVTLVENYQQQIDAHKQLNDAALAQRGGFFTAYQTNDSIDAFTLDLATLNPAIVSRSVIGQSHLGNDIHTLVVTAPYAMGEQRRPQVVLNGCQHAREWISPATVLYILNELVTGFGNDPVVDEMLGGLEFHIIPMVNPDGYEYTFSDQRLWRKNRRPVSGTVGVDLNRNWDFEWGGAGSSGSPTSETYRGPAPFSEPESTVLSNYLLTLPDIHAHIDFHNFAQAILGPWAYSTSDTPPRAQEHIVIQDAMASAMTNTNGVGYIAGLGTDAILGPAAGAMPDWTLGVLNALSWTIELRPASSFPGFELPPDQIIGTGEESFEAIKVLAEFAARTLEIQPAGEIPAFVSADEPTGVAVTITEFNLEELDESTATLFYRVGGSGAFTQEPLVESGGVFGASLPTVACGQTIEFYFSAESTGSVVATLPDDAPMNVFTAEGSPITTVFDDNFQTDTGWTVSGSVSDGAWERAVPIGGGDRGDPPADADGSGLCYLTDAEDGNSDVDDGTTILTSPVFDLSDGGVVSYSYWLGTSNNFQEDSLTVEIATDPAGTNWNELRSYTTPMTSWQSDSIDVAVEASASATVRLRFLATDGGTPSVIEAGVDGVSILQTGECCPGDCDASGAVDFGDLIAMLGFFGTPGGADGCDVDNDGSVTFGDLVAALSLFGSCD